MRGHTILTSPSSRMEGGQTVKLILLYDDYDVDVNQVCFPLLWTSLLQQWFWCGSGVRAVTSVSSIFAVFLLNMFWTHSRITFEKSIKIIFQSCFKLYHNRIKGFCVLVSGQPARNLSILKVFAFPNHLIQPDPRPFRKRYQNHIPNFLQKHVKIVWKSCQKPYWDYDTRFEVYRDHVLKSYQKPHSSPKYVLNLVS